ncbi:MULTISPECIES: serine hydrolase domain-containing protein [unclassified Sphingopyxis]|uniref:serine hydrolase domain-containing protein n=1 Tax=unclassified Sphingopyxis TaxID=2614943 RepID=UPI000736C772|nr:MULTISPECIES: serine hydrolase domain-containing protein [unclassified Sphingopyxis]KTE46573.1 serine hydrolase [Sphingopyxis sp. HIX]KTE85705.1 serine hydrolase [Sphingopyxis sp. HXXIV]
MSQGFDTARLDRIPAFLQAKYVGPGRLPHAATLVSRHGEVVHQSCVGDARPGEALKSDAIFRIASMTKPITSIAFMMLVEEGKVALGDPLVKFCPEFRDTGVFVAGGGNIPFVTRPPATPIRMVDLLRHTSGLTYGFQERTPVDAAYRKARIDDFDAAYTMDSFIEGLSKIPLQFDPGAHWNYSMATDVLGAVVERIEGKPFAEVLHERIFGPLGMVDTGFKVPAARQHRLTDCYVFDPAEKMKIFDNGATSRWAKDRSFHSGGGGLVSTLADYHRFCLMLLGGGQLDGTRIVSRKTLALMTANHLVGGGDLVQHSVGIFSEAENAGVGFGLGFAVTEQPAQTLTPGSVGDYYWGGMFSTGFFVDPVEQICSVFMTQLMPSSTYPVRREVKTFVHAALND